MFHDLISYQRRRNINAPINLRRLWSHRKKPRGTTSLHRETRIDHRKGVAVSPDQFPLLEAHARRPVRFIEAVRAVIDGVENGAIRNVVLNDAKYVLSQTVCDAWKKHVSEPYLHGKYDTNDTALRELDYSLHVMGLHDMVATSKKLAKTKATGPAVDAMRAFAAQALPLAEAVAGLKSKVVKGRAPSAAPAKPVNPNKDVKTCPCCFRQIAVVRTKMALHGYERPGTGWQTSSCPGVDFKPLEVSSDGLAWLIGQISARHASNKTAYRNRNKLTELWVTRNRAPVKVLKDSTHWDREFSYHVGALEREISSLGRELIQLRKRLADWTPGVHK